MFDRAEGLIRAGAGHRHAVSDDVTQGAELAGRIALATQGALYVVVGLLAGRVAMGDRGADPNQRGALESLARQPFGQVLLVVAMIGLAAYAGWRLWLAWAGEPGAGDDAKSAAKRAANVGRAAIYLSILGAAFRLLTKTDGGDSGEERDAAEQSTDTILSLPGGPWLVVLGGLVFVGVGLWNVRKAVTQSFSDDLDMGRIDLARRPTVCRFGTVGYLARGASFALIGWFLFNAGRQHDASEGRGLDDALQELATAPLGTWLLGAVAVGLVAFGAFRVFDGLLRRPDALTHS